MVFTTQEEEILKLIVEKTILEMKMQSVRGVENSGIRTLQNSLFDSTAALKAKCIER